MDFKKVKQACAVTGFTVVLFLALWNIDFFGKLLQTLLGVMFPFIVGVIIAFLLDGVADTFRYKIYAPLFKRAPRIARFAKPLAILSTYLFLLIVFSLLVGIVAPQIVTSVTSLAESIPGYVRVVNDWAVQLMEYLKFDEGVWLQFNEWLAQFVQAVFNFVPTLIGMIPRFYGIVMTVGSGVFNILIGLIVSIYILADKQRLMSQMNRINRAFLPRRAARAIGNAAHITYKTFRSYVTGQLLDALIVGVISSVGLSLLNFPYAMLIGVVMGASNIVPFFGPFIGAIPGFLIICMVNPVQALWYILFVTVLQQLDGNLIVPRIMGSSIGLPPLWVLFAVTVGAGMFGIAGMIIGMPVFAVFYKLLGQAVRRRERARAVRKCMYAASQPPAANTNGEPA